MAAVLAFVHLSAGSTAAQPAEGDSVLTDRIEGLLLGSVLGDAAGGPFEFREPDRSLWTTRAEPLDAPAVAALSNRFRLAPYLLVDRAAPYGPWRDDAPAGTVTDDTRFKIIFMHSLEAEKEPSVEAFAREILRRHADTDGPYGELPHLWLNEFAFAARWVLGERDPQTARPPGRQWGGIATMAGQMPFLPLAALNAGDPEAAYTAVWEVNFLDNGPARDINAAVVAGLAAALETGADWSTVEHAMRSTDPYKFGDVLYVDRRLDRWLDAAHSIARRADRRPDRLYRLLEQELGAETWWEAHVPLVVVFAAAETADYDPLATMQLILEFGHDTDSYLQLAGAFFGALHGQHVFPEELTRIVRERLAIDYGESVSDWAARLVELRVPRN